jgi:Fe-S cluster assembly protein SufB
MLDFRLRSYDIFMKKPMPVWGGDLSKINFQNIFYYTRASEKQSKSWDDVPDSVRKTFDKLGIPEAEKKFLAGVGAQYESETVYHNLREDLSKQGVIFSDTDTAVKEHPEILKKYFGKVIPPEDNKFAALNSAVWSGGSFIYVPPNVKIELPLQAYFRINAENIGQFERTLIIADEGSEVHYIEGCTAPVYTTESLHSAVVELILRKMQK